MEERVYIMILQTLGAEKIAHSEIKSKFREGAGGLLEHHAISRKADHGQHGTRVTFLSVQFFKCADPIEKKASENCQ